jgi:hypothetical protein
MRSLVNGIAGGCSPGNSKAREKRITFMSEGNTAPAAEVKEATTAEKIFKVFATAVQLQVEAGDHKKWGQDDSREVIRAISDEAYGLEEGFDVISDYVFELCNPSAFKQKLQAKPEGHPCRIEKGEASGKTRASVLKGL